LHYIHDAGCGYFIRQPFAVLQLLARNENRHVLSQRALVIDDIAPDRRIPLKVGIQNFTHGRTWNLSVGTLDVPTKVGRDAQQGHKSDLYTYQKTKEPPTVWRLSSKF
jgi:hypothetical protein